MILIVKGQVSLLGRLAANTLCSCWEAINVAAFCFEPEVVIDRTSC